MKEQVTPMMRQYLETKEQYNDCILFYRLGDFYEMFFDDALTASRELEITLTGKDCGLKERAPMCGVPYHSAQVYISRLISKGYNVAICEQVEDPKTAKGIVKREVIRVVTPGTVSDSEMLDEKKNNYLASVFLCEQGAGLAFSDISTGELFAVEIAPLDRSAVFNEIARYAPAEMILNEYAQKSIGDAVKNRFNAAVHMYDENFDENTAREKVLVHFRRDNLAELSLDNRDFSVRAVGALILYFEHTQKSSLNYINTITAYEINQYMDIDLASRRNLEITESMRDRTKRGSLLWVLDRTETSMGARLLKQWLEKPLINPISINNRLYSVRELVDNMMLRDDLTAILSGIYDIARIASRISLGSVNPRELISLKASLTKLPELEGVLRTCKSPMLAEMRANLDIMADVRETIESAICDEPPALVKDGGVIKEGYNEEIDLLRKAMTEGKQWILQIENDEREATGIKNLKIGFNKVFGYYIEVTKSNLDNIPDTYVRKQTLTNCERFITPKLKEIENLVMGASEKISNIESHVYGNVVTELAKQSERFKQVCNVIAVTDVLASLAEVAYKYNYTMPDFVTTGEISIKNGRHPVVEKMMKNELFVPNDTYLNSDDSRLSIITGPNMAGKSTYMRQVALITLMAQIGSFVPAESAKITAVDKIFTRIGASDDIASGQSTFMLEMSEMSNILLNATRNSLLILDEIGRGTSTFDGLSIAWAIAEYILDKKKIGAKTLFATHYHEMTQLESTLDGVKNYHVAVKKRGDDITFLRKVLHGEADGSYGIEVAAIAGVPGEVTRRAKKILEKLENDDIVYTKPEKKETGNDAQIGFGDVVAGEIKEELKNLDVTTFTPIEALNKLYELANKAKEI